MHDTFERIKAGILSQISLIFFHECKMSKGRYTSCNGKTCLNQNILFVPKCEFLSLTFKPFMECAKFLIQ